MSTSANSASVYRDIRAKYFAWYHKGIPLKAILSAIDREPALFPNQKIGMKAEVEFYASHEGTIGGLTATLDCGDHADFTGTIEGKPSRIDVTTNRSYKRLDDYIAFLPKHNYVIVEKQQSGWEFVPLDFPLCKICKTGALIGVLVVAHAPMGSNPLNYPNFLVDWRLCTNGCEPVIGQEFLLDSMFIWPSIGDVLEHELEYDKEFMTKNQITEREKEIRTSTINSRLNAAKKLFRSTLLAYGESGNYRMKSDDYETKGVEFVDGTKVYSVDSLIDGYVEDWYDESLSEYE